MLVEPHRPTKGTLKRAFLGYERSLLKIHNSRYLDVCITNGLKEKRYIKILDDWADK